MTEAVLGCSAGPGALLALQSPEILDLQRRLATLETQLASQVAVVKDSYGNLKLQGNASITIESAVHNCTGVARRQSGAPPSR